MGEESATEEQKLKSRGLKGLWSRSSVMRTDKKVMKHYMGFTLPITKAKEGEAVSVMSSEKGHSYREQREFKLL